MEASGRCQLDWVFPVRPPSFQAHARARPARRADHQQWLDLRACAAPRHSGLYRHGQIDIGNAETPMTERMVAGVMQANGVVEPEDRMDVDHVAQAVLQMAELPLETNVQFMTIMATKMPFIGRG